MSPSILSVDIQGDVIPISLVDIQGDVTIIPLVDIQGDAMSSPISLVDIRGDVCSPSCRLTLKAMSSSLLSVDIEGDVTINPFGSSKAQKPIPIYIKSRVGYSKPQSHWRESSSLITLSFSFSSSSSYRAPSLPLLVLLFTGVLLHLHTQTPSPAAATYGNRTTDNISSVQHLQFRTQRISIHAFDHPFRQASSRSGRRRAAAVLITPGLRQLRPDLVSTASFNPRPRLAYSRGFTSNHHLRPPSSPDRASNTAGELPVFE
ncbi:hypothetical protein HHK36_017663 [Tetracentron sinense]|uniref:Uncharacterized protein n=1 Tax=Tetracentron sinense TaxID=13715 RepID=A0A834Z2E0_TETSI|nr:hypothetical protein HHK36_017663 [Tetracentron sinense]